jgi:hypothetical protein
MKQNQSKTVERTIGFLFYGYCLFTFDATPFTRSDQDDCSAGEAII